MKIKTLSLITLSFLLAVSCNENSKNKENEMNDPTKEDTTATSGTITLEKLEGSSSYDNASLKLNQPEILN